MSVGAPVAPSRPVTRRIIATFVGVLLLGVAASWSTPATAQPTEPSAALTVRLAHAVDEGAAGDLRTDPSSGLPRLALNPDRRTATAVLEVVVANGGGVRLDDVVVADDLFGDATVGVLEPGARTTVTLTRTVTLDEVASGLAGRIEHRTRVTGATPDGTVVAEQATGAVLFEAVLPTPQLAVEATVVGSGEVVWSGPQAAADEERVAPVDVTVRNQGDVDLVDVAVAGAVDGGTVQGPSPFDLAAGEERLVRVEVTLLPDVVEVDEPLRDGISLREDVIVMLDATGATEDGATTEARDQVTVTAVLGEPVPVRDEAIDLEVIGEDATGGATDRDAVEDEAAAEPQLPAAGLAADRVALLALLALVVGTAAVASAARERREQHDLGTVGQR